MYNETPVDTFATNVRRGNGKNMCCVFCKGDHYNDECEKFKWCVPPDASKELEATTSRVFYEK